MEEEAASQLERKQAILQRLEALSSVEAKGKSGRRSQVPSAATHVVPVVVTKIDTHWDYLLKEMQWLAADFISERKRHVAGAKKWALSAATHHEGAAAREARALQAARQLQRKVAARLGRACLKQYWGPVQRVVTYQQKVSYDQFRQQQMNQQLVRLVQQTEQYTALLANTDDAAENPMDRIESALAQTELRRGKHRVQDYARLWHEVVTTDGETSWLEDSGTEDPEQSSDASYSEVSSSTDDESTLRAAEAEERRERALGSDDSASFVGDPQELRQLQEEADMVIDQVLERLRNEAGPSNHPSEENTSARRVQFVEVLDPTGSDADDDMDASDVEDYQEGDEEEDEYVMEMEEPDDETTLEQEERLPQELSAEEELRLLQEENELSVEELRQKYSAALTNPIAASEAVETDMESSNEVSTDPVGEDDEDDDEYVPAVEEVDDETTLAAEEKLGRDMTYAEELALLQQDNERSVEELRAMYAESAEIVVPDDDVEMVDEEVTEEEKGSHDLEAEDRLVKRRRVEGDTSSTGEVVPLEERPRLVTRPFLIPSWVKLREYQHVGLNWLVALQTRRLNGILADEMGLGKTLQTIALLAYLASYQGIWGPHLIVVPTSVILNWETELKRFCPALKVLCYYGSAKRRKELRTGWTKSNWFHVVVTSYQLVVQDSFAFKRKRWYYLVLDEAQHIKNFQSQRWQTLISFNTQRRLLLTGTPLQNNLMELWSLLHFLMPYIFRSRKEFSYWFANPMNSMIEGASGQNEDVVNRLHEIIRPFILRRLKKDVETQMPGKFEHIIKCQLSRRQMFIYEEFMARSSTRQALQQGANFMGMMNVLMQLRKVCNHPDLFEPRSVVTPLVVDPIIYPMASSVVDMRRSTSPFAQVSDCWIFPLWSVCNGVPSLYAALEHDTIHSDELLELESNLDVQSAEHPTSEEREAKDLCPALRALNAEIFENEIIDRKENVLFLNNLSFRRCRASPFPCPRRQIDAVALPELPLLRSKSNIHWSPGHLLALRRDLQERADDMSEIISRFVFAVPKAGARPVILETCVAHTGNGQRNILEDSLNQSLRATVRPFREAHARITSFFPDKKLVQFDAGKLQALAELLRERKHGGHKVLIFTQMSKMLDILEAFLNMNGHTYARLDGGTSIDQRQRLMDRFNNDPKVFCFILSTRSGGTGVNLIGADTVVFYDSDWNPAQDAQAQDRAHRIGQTREVHIFRLVTEHTIEENILRKAKQKRNLDVLVMDKGNFDASQLKRRRIKSVDLTSESNRTNSLYTKGGLREILGISFSDGVGGAHSEEDDVVTSEQIETTMTSLEDVDDVKALHGSRKEAAEELKEFDESIEYKKDSDADDEEEPKVEVSAEDYPKNNISTEEKELEKEIAAWQENSGVDPSIIESSLLPVERYGLRFCKVIDPYYSIFAVKEYQEKLESQSDETDEIDIGQIEREKELEESRAFEEGDLLATHPRPDDLIRQMNLYRREKSRLNAIKKRRRLTGQNWEYRAESNQSHYWYNIDTGEALWDKPKVLIDQEAYNQAIERKWSFLPLKPLIHIMSYLLPFPDRLRSSEVCSHWCKAAKDPSFVRHVYPVEMGAYTRDEAKMEFNHFRTIEDAVKSSLPGDTIELGDGHYWQNLDLVIDWPLKLIGDENSPANVVIEISGRIIWRACGGFVEGVTFRRPKISSGERSLQDLLFVENKGKMHVKHSILDNEGGCGNVVTLCGPCNLGNWEDVAIRNGVDGLILRNCAKIALFQCFISNNSKSGVVCEDLSGVTFSSCRIEKNGEYGIRLKGQSHSNARRSHISGNGVGAIQKDSGCTATSSGNVFDK